RRESRRHDCIATQLLERDPRRLCKQTTASNSVANTRRQKEPPGFGAVPGLKAYLHRCLEHTRATDAVDIAHAAAQGAGDLAKVRPESSVWQAKGGSIGHVEGIEAGFQRRLAVYREPLEERHVVREVSGATEL